MSARRFRAATGWLSAVLLLAGVQPGCRRDLPVAVAPRDSVPPAIHVVFPDPNAPAYDRDSNGLLDLELRWADSAGRVSPATLRVVAIEGGVPGFAADSNLVPGWRVVRLDTTGAVLEETVGGLLREGKTRFAISVADTAGNVAADTGLVVMLPPGAYHGAIPVAGMPSCQHDRGVNLALSADGKKGFVPYNGCVAVFDPDGVQPAHFITGVPDADFAVDISVDTTSGLAYIGGGIGGQGYTVLDTRSEQVVGTHYIEQGRQVASVKVAGRRLFIGESCTNGRVDVYDIGSLLLLGQIEVNAPPWYSSCPNTHSMVASSDFASGWGAVVARGLVHLDLSSYSTLERLSADSSYDGWGMVRSVRLVEDRWVEAALLCDGIEEFDTRPWHLVVRFGNPARAAPCYNELALSQDGTSLFVSADSTGQTWMAPDSVQTPYLFDVPGLRLRYAFPHRRGGITDAAVWHPDGRRVYLMDELQVDVYIVRPRPGS